MTTTSGTGYWVTQIGACAFAALAAPALGVFFFIAEPAEPGKGLLLILIGVMFLGCLVWLVRTYRRMSTVQRAVYAWAIAQQHGSAAERGVPADAAIMASAARAMKGELSRDEVLALQALHPGNPFPGTIPAS